MKRETKEMLILIPLTLLAIWSMVSIHHDKIKQDSVDVIRFNSEVFKWDGNKYTNNIGDCMEWADGTWNIKTHKH